MFTQLLFFNALVLTAAALGLAIFMDEKSVSVAADDIASLDHMVHVAYYPSSF